MRKKTRQLEVKKNEEYQALETGDFSIGDLQSQKEDEQIEVLVKIDDAQATALIAQDKITLKKLRNWKAKSNFEGRINKVKNLKLLILKKKSKKLVNHEKGRSESMFRTYDRVKK